MEEVIVPAERPTIEPLKPDFTVQCLGSEQLEQLQEAALNILEDVGVRFPFEKALKVFAEHGAKVDWDKEIVKMSPELVSKVLATAPRCFTWGARDLAFDLHLEKNVSYFTAVTHQLDAQSNYRDPLEVAREKVNWILDNHKPEPLERARKAELTRILEAAGQEIEKTA